MSPDFPPYSYVPGGHWPHPKSHPEGHSYHITHSPAVAPDPSQWHENVDYIIGCSLFNAGYYWEAHETWEAQWHAAGRKGPMADFLKGLIKLAAAGVKVREGVPNGVRTHAKRAEEIFLSLCHNVGSDFMGLNLPWLAGKARDVQKMQIAGAEPERNRAVLIVFDFRLSLE